MCRKSFLLLTPLMAVALGLSVLQHALPTAVSAAPALQIANCMFSNFTSADNEMLNCEDRTCGTYTGCDVAVSPLNLPTCASANGPFSIDVAAHPCEEDDVCAPIFTVYDANGRITGCGGLMTLGGDGLWRGSCSCITSAPTAVAINYISCGPGGKSKGFDLIQVKVCCTSGC